jgi:Cytochrome P450
LFKYRTNKIMQVGTGPLSADLSEWIHSLSLSMRLPSHPSVTISGSPFSRSMHSCIYSRQTMTGLRDSQRWQTSPYLRPRDSTTVELAMRVILEKGNILLAISLIFSLWLLSVLRKGYKQRSFYKTVPCPPHSPFWGHLKLMGEMIAGLPPKFHYQQVMAYIGQKYNLPSVFYLDMWPVSYPMMIIQDPGIAAQITQTKSLPKHIVNHHFISPLTGRTSIVITEGAEWKMIRSIVNPGFSPSYIASLTPVIGKHINKFTHKLSKAVSTGEVLLLQDYLLSLTFDVISEVTLGFDLDSQRSFNQLAYHFGQAAQWSFVPSSTLSPHTIASKALKWWHARQEGLIISNMIKQRCNYQAAVNGADSSIRRAGIDSSSKHTMTKRN